MPGIARGVPQRTLPDRRDALDDRRPRRSQRASASPLQHRAARGPSKRRDRSSPGHRLTRPLRLAPAIRSAVGVRGPDLSIYWSVRSHPFDPCADAGSPAPPSRSPGPTQWPGEWRTSARAARRTAAQSTGLRPGPQSTRRPGSHQEAAAVASSLSVLKRPREPPFSLRCCHLPFRPDSQFQSKDTERVCIRAVAKTSARAPRAAGLPQRRLPRAAAPDILRGAGR